MSNIATPTIHNQAPSVPLDYNVAAWGDILAEWGMDPGLVERQRFQLSSDVPEITFPTPSDSVNVTHLIYAQHKCGAFSTVYPRNVARASFRALGLLFEQPENRKAANGTASQHLAEDLSIIADSQIRGHQAIDAENNTVVHRAVRQTKLAATLGLTLASALSVAAYGSAEQAAMPPWLVTVVGVGVTALAGLKGYGMVRDAKNQTIKFHNAYQSWPAQLRAQQRAQAWRQQYDAGQTPALVEFTFAKHSRP